MWCSGFFGWPKDCHSFWGRWDFVEFGWANLVEQSEKPPKFSFWPGRPNIYLKLQVKFHHFFPWRWWNRCHLFWSFRFKFVLVAPNSDLSKWQAWIPIFCPINVQNLMLFQSPPNVPWAFRSIFPFWPRPPFFPVFLFTPPFFFKLQCPPPNPWVALQALRVMVLPAVCGAEPHCDVHRVHAVPLAPHGGEQGA